MFSILLGLLTETVQKPIEYVQPTVAQAYYEPVPQVETPIDPIATNCYAYVSQYVKLPLTRDILANTTPYEGVVVIFQYKVPHYAILEKLTDDGFWVKESNYTPGVIGRRFIPWDDPHLKGFYKPATSGDGQD